MNSQSACRFRFVAIGGFQSAVDQQPFPTLNRLAEGEVEKLFRIRSSSTQTCYCLRS